MGTRLSVAYCYPKSDRCYCLRQRMGQAGCVTDQLICVWFPGSHLSKLPLKMKSSVIPSWVSYYRTSCNFKATKICQTWKEKENSESCTKINIFLPQYQVFTTDHAIICWLLLIWNWLMCQGRSCDIKVKKQNRKHCGSHELLSCHLGLEPHTEEL